MPLVLGIRVMDLSLASATPEGEPLVIVSKQLGQSSSAITADVYTHMNAEMQSDAAELGAAVIANV